MFDDPQTVIGAIIGLLIVIGGTTLATLGHIRKQREIESEAGQE